MKSRRLSCFLQVMLLMVLAVNAKAQTIVRSYSDVILSQHWEMPALLNPSFAGNIDFVRLRGSVSLQGLGAYHSPKNFIGSIDSPFKIVDKKIGAGIIVNSSSYDLFHNILVGIQGSYKFRLKEGNFNIGVQLGYYRSKLKWNHFQHDFPDNSLPESTVSNYENLDINSKNLSDDQSANKFDLGFGISYEHPYVHIGLSALHLTNTSIKFSDSLETSNDNTFIENKLSPALYLDIGGNIKLNNTLFTLQPTILLGTDFDYFNALVEMRATYNGKVTFGFDYRWNKAVGVLAGINIKNFYLGYSWEYDYSSSVKRTAGNHELMIGYQFRLDMGGRKKYSHKSIRLM